jgi:hypothetical protein
MNTELARDEPDNFWSPHWIALYAFSINCDRVLQEQIDFQWRTQKIGASELPVLVHDESIEDIISFGEFGDRARHIVTESGQELGQLQKTHVPTDHFVVPEILFGVQNEFHI